MFVGIRVPRGDSFTTPSYHRGIVHRSSSAGITKQQQQQSKVLGYHDTTSILRRVQDDGGLLVCFSSSRMSESGGQSEDGDDVIPPNCSRYKVKLQKPLGLVLEETADGIRVAEVQVGGNAERLGMISPRDQLIATSGFIRTTQQVYGEITVQGGERMIRLNVRGQSWETVMAAISSHLAGMEVELEFQKCSDEE
jgi:hypothetical protein